MHKEIEDIDKVAARLIAKLTNSFKEARKSLNNDYPHINVAMNYSATDKMLGDVYKVVLSFTVSETED